MRLLSIIGLIFIFVSCRQQPSEDAVITVGDETISMEELAPVLAQYHGDSQMVYSRINSQINRLLILQDACARGFDTLPEMKRYQYERERELLQAEWIDWILDEKVSLPADTVENFYSQMGSMVRYTTITVEDSILCDSLRKLVLAGHDLADLVMVFSSSPYELSTGGFVGPVDRIMTSPYDVELLQGLEVNDVSPMDTFPSGWRFLQIDSIYQDTIPPLEEIEELLSQSILGRMRQDYKHIVEDSLRTVNEFRVIEGIPELIAEHAIDNIGNYRPYSAEQLEMAACTFTGGERSVYYLVENIRNLPSSMPRTPTDPDWVEGYCRLLGLYDMMAMEARKMQMDTLPEIVYFVERRVSNKLLDIYYDSVIKPQTEPSYEELLETYEDNIDMLLVPEARVFKAVGAFGEDQLETLSQIITSGQEPFVFVDELTKLTSILAPDEDVLTNPLKVSDIPDQWSEMLFEAELNETVICSLSMEQVFVFRLEQIIPEHHATFEESRDNLIDLITTEKEEEAVTGLVDSLRSVYHIYIDRDLIDGFIYADSTASELPSEQAPDDTQKTL